MADVEGALRSSVRDELRHIGWIPAASKLYRPSTGFRAPHVGGRPRPGARRRGRHGDGAGGLRQVDVHRRARGGRSPPDGVGLPDGGRERPGRPADLRRPGDRRDRPGRSRLRVGPVGTDTDGRLAGPAAVRRHVRRPPPAVHARPRRHARAGSRRGARRRECARQRAAARLAPRSRRAPRDPSATGPDARAAPSRRGRPGRPGVRRARGRDPVRRRSASTHRPTR